MAINRPFQTNPQLTSIAIAYRNSRLIADAVLPRTPVGQKEFQYHVYTKEDRFTLPDTRVGRRSAPNEVEFGATLETAVAEDYGLEDPVPQDDIDNAPEGFDPLGNATEGIMDLILLDREVRTANLVFAAGTYPSGNKITLLGTDQWSDFSASDPIDDIQTGIDTPLMRPNKMVLGRQTASVLLRHPDILKAFNGTAGDSGIAPSRFLAELFGLDEVQIGEGWVNTANPGQTPTFSRVWGKHCSLIHTNPVANTRRGVTFGYTGQFGNRVAGTFEDRNIGLRGGQRVRAGETVAEVISAADAGYFIENAVA